MDLSLNTVVDLLQANICRCCLRSVNNRHSNVSLNKYVHKGNFEEMLKNIFNIQLTQQDITGYIPDICEDCIGKIEKAKTLKEMVVNSEERFAKWVARLHYTEAPIKDTEFKYDVQVIKTETLPVTDYCEDSLDDNVNLANIKLELTQNGDSKSEIKKEIKEIKIRTKDFKIKTELGINKKDWSKIAARRGNGPILRENSLKLLANSTIFVFQWNMSRYRCFCCKEPFSDVKLLREHTNTKHSLKCIEKKIIYQQNRLVKVEISELKCTICSQKQQNLDILRDHLIMSHNIQFESNECLLVPFKINEEFTCQICNESFSVFRYLNIHMNKHYQKQVCHICGAAFSNLVFLNLHKSRYHKSFDCQVCEVNFTKKIDKRNHDILVHNVKIVRKLRFPCPYCDERFYQENFKVQHMVDKHGLKRPEFRCTICSKVFLTKSLCNNHLKTVHLKEKRHECGTCHQFFYTKSSVARHMVTHTGEKKYSCEMCSNLFSSKDSLRRHVRKAHGMH